MTVHLLSAGAAKSVVNKLVPPFTAETGAEIDCTFSAVGEMRDAMLAGTPCDLLILTRASIDELFERRQLRVGSVAALGAVTTGIAIRTGDVVPDLSDAIALRACLLHASAIFTADLTRSTGGIHFASVLHELGIYADVEPRLRIFPNGAIALAAQASHDAAGALGCSQRSEINYTDGVSFAGPLPGRFGLRTTYAGAVTAKAAQPDLAGRLLEWLTTERSAELRRKEGFEV